MGITQIVGGTIVLLSAVIIIILALAQSKKAQDMSSALSGQSAQDNFIGKAGKGSSREDSIASLTKVMAIIFFVATLALNVLMAFGL